MIYEPDRLYAGNRLDRINDTLLHSRYLVPAVAGHAQLEINQDGVLRLKAEACVQRAHQPPQGDEGRGDQHRTDGNLHNKQQVTNCYSLPDDAAEPRFDNLIRIDPE